MVGDAVRGAGDDAGDVFVTFANHDSGCRSRGVVVAGVRCFVKDAQTDAGAASLRNAIRFHSAVQHPAIVAPVETVDRADGVRLIYPWVEGEVLNQATTDGPDRRALERFRQLSVERARRAIDRILDAHLTVTEAGFVAVDLYDGCFLHDGAADDSAAMHLIDLDEYRPAPFTVVGDRLPGSLRYMAPEELRRGATIDEQTTVFNLGRTIQHLLQGRDGWRGTSTELAVAHMATAPEPSDRLPTVRTLVAAWSAAR